MLPELAQDLSVPIGQVVLLTSAYSLPFAMMQVVFGPLGEALGKTRVLLYSLGAVCISMLLMSVAPGFYSLLACRMLSGAVAGGIGPVTIALLSDRVAVEHRQVALGRLLSALIGGQVVGASVAGLLVGLIGWRWVVVLAALVVGLVCVLAAFKLRGRIEARSSPSLRKSFAMYRTALKHPEALFLMVAIMLESALVMGLIPFVAAMLQQRSGTAAAQAGIVIGCFAIGGLVFGGLVSWLVRRLGPLNMIRTGCVLAGAGLAISAIRLPWGVTALCFVAVGLGFYMMHNSLMLRVTELNPSARGAATSVGAFSFTTGQGLGPIGWTGLAGGVGYSALFGISAVCFALLGLAAAALLQRRLRHVALEQSNGPQ